MKTTENNHFQALKRAAWENRDLDLFEFYVGIEHELQGLRAVCRVVAHMYENGLSDDGWSTLFEALSDAGLLSDLEPEPERSGMT